MLHDEVDDAYRRAVEHLRSLQASNGALAGEVIWNPMLVCQYVMVRHVLGQPLPKARRNRIRLSLQQQVRGDGGWGMHPDSDSWLFHTVLGYVALRLLGTPPDEPLVARAREWIHDHGGVYPIPTWGRIWLALLGLYPWHSIQPIPPELWLLPASSPMHPSRLYCHMRLIYLGLSYLYGQQHVAPADETVTRIREELYPEGYLPARFDRHRDEIAVTDVFEKPGSGLRAAFRAMRAMEHVTPQLLRRRALATAYEHMLFEFRSTDYVCLSPVNGLLYCLALYITNPDHPDLPRALEGLEYWVWEDDTEGMRICGARSDIWDTSFVIQALCEGPPDPRAEAIVRDCTRWLPTAQIQQEIVGGAAHYRSPAYGGWGFANERHPWPVSDCTAEALEALLHAEHAGLHAPDSKLQIGRKLAALEFVLQRQNDDGGFGSYEPRRGNMILRHFNPAEIYGNCMLEYSYTECTGSCIRSLAIALRRLDDAIPAESRARLRTAIDGGARFILSRQHANGAWPGFWGINYTYGTLFAVTGLLEAGTSRHHPAIARACRWLVEHQRTDGGWGEGWRGMLDDSEAPLPENHPSLVVQTAWALLTLLKAAPHEREVIDNGVRFLLQRQHSSGAWPREPATGCFFNTAVLDYDYYRYEFPTWALARYSSTYR